MEDSKNDLDFDLKLLKFGSILMSYGRLFRELTAEILVQ